MHRFENRTALITAAGSGVGRGVALRLAAEGARVTVWDIDTDALGEVQTEARSSGLSVATKALDMTDEAAIGKAVEAQLAVDKRIDVLVNNIGGSLHTPAKFLEQSEEDWARVIDVNITACVRTTRAVLPSMVAHGYGRIINMGSKAGRYASAFAGANYVAAKGAMQAFTLQIAKEFGPHGITCNTVCPGAILTPRVDRLLSERFSEDERRRFVESIPVGRYGAVEDVAAAIAYLTSQEASFVSGASLDVNGGQAMAI